VYKSERNHAMNIMAAVELPFVADGVTANAVCLADASLPTWVSPPKGLAMLYLTEFEKVIQRPQETRKSGMIKKQQR
jgi:hypothetical protein